MSWMVGLGRGLADAGQTWSNSILAKEKQRREDEAIERALTQQNVDNTMQFENIGLQHQARNEQRRMNDSVIAQNEIENNARNYDQALKSSTNFPNAPLPENVAQEWLSDARAPMVNVHEATPMRPAQPAKMGVGGLGEKVFGMFGDVGTNPDEEITRPAMPTSYTTRPSESEKLRISTQNNANRMAVAQLRDRFLQSKLAQDKSLAEMANSLGRDRLQALIDQSEQTLGFRYDNMDAETAQRNAQMQTDILVANIRAEAQKSNPMLGILLGATQGQPGAAAPSAPKPPVQAPQVQIPPRGGAQSAPPPTTGSSVGDRIRERARQKGQ